MKRIQLQWQGKASSPFFFCTWYFIWQARQAKRDMWQSWEKNVFSVIIFNTSNFNKLGNHFSTCATCHSSSRGPLWLKWYYNLWSNISGHLFIEKCVSTGKRQHASVEVGRRVLTQHINKVARRLITRTSICQACRQAVRLLSPPWTLCLRWFSPAAGHEYWPMHPRLKHNICFSTG